VVGLSVCKTWKKIRAYLDVSYEIHEGREKNERTNILDMDWGSKEKTDSQINRYDGLPKDMLGSSDTV